VIPGQHRPELPDRLGRPSLGGELAGLDVGGVGGVEDGHDGRVVERGLRVERGGEADDGSGGRREGEHSHGILLRVEGEDGRSDPDKMGILH
jgi:hypothetical protein